VAWRLAALGEADLVVVPVARRLAVDEVMEPLGDFGVACRGVVGSVLLFAEVPVAKLAQDRLPIHLTKQSETSRRLLRVLWKREYGVEPALTVDPAAARARLLIGDEALREHRRAQRWPVVVDLCAWWELQTGLPFVFARWMVRRCAGVGFKYQARTWLERCVETAQTSGGREVMAQRALTAGLFANHEAAVTYLSRLRSRFDASDCRGEALFLDQVAVHLAR
jgi:chorismate dehydratase